MKRIKILLTMLFLLSSISFATGFQFNVMGNQMPASQDVSGLRLNLFHGKTANVTGVDFTEEMLVKANINLEKTGFKNINFVQGDIEKMPLADDSYDVAISNCVLNLVPDKQKAFREIHRVLKPGGHFCISDVVLEGKLPKKLEEAAEMYAGCVSGAVQKEEYLQIIKDQGFRNIEIKSAKEIQIPNSILLNYITLDELRELKKNKVGIYSITVNAVK